MSATSEDWVRATAKMVGFDAEVADAAVARLGAAAQPAPASPKSTQPVASRERVAEVARVLAAQFARNPPVDGSKDFTIDARAVLALWEDE